DHVARQKHRRLVVRRKHDRCVPVETKLLPRGRSAATAATPRINKLLLARAEVSPDNTAALRLRQINFGIVGIVDDVKAVAKTDHAPVVVLDAGRFARAARSGP